MTSRFRQTTRTSRRQQTLSCLVLLFITCLLVFSFLARKGKAQTASLPQANSPKEFDAYLLVLSKKTPTEIIAAGNEFANAWPHSELLAAVYQLEMEAYRSLNDPTNAIQAGQKALQAAPDNVTVMATLAYILADEASDQQHLALAQQYARKALTTLKTFRVSKQTSPKQWETIQRLVQSQVHAAFGLVAYKRGDTPAAIRQFEASLNLAPVPSPVQCYRLGLLYEASGKRLKAMEMFRRAAQLNNAAIQRLAEKRLDALQH